MENILKDKNFDTENQNLFKKFSFHKKTKIYEKNIKLLIPWRDEKARTANIPRSFVLKDEIINLIAEKNPQNLEEFNKVAFANKLNDRLKMEILTILQNNFLSELSARQEENGLNFKLSEKQNLIYIQAKNLLGQKSLSQNLRPEFIINQNNLKMIILGHKSIAEVLSGWRFIVLGEDLNNLIKNIQ